MSERIIAGKYAVKGEIARGGMGIVYRALHTTLNRDVAVKVLHTQYSGDPSFLARFQREARAMARLSHPNIIAVFDVTEEAGAHSIVMEYFHGKDLKRLIMEQGRFSAVDTIRVGAQVADGLAYAHAQGIVHRDIKPGNIMLDDRLRVKIADFGIAAATDEISVTATGQIIGTPEYMSPEQARGEQLDGRSDLYSLGMVLYELVTGETPFSGVSRMAIVGKLLYEKDELNLTFPDGVPEALKDLIRTLLKKHRDDRIQDAPVLLSRFRTLDPAAAVFGAPAHTDPAISAPPPPAPVAGNDPATLLYREDHTGTVQAARPQPSSPVTTPRSDKTPANPPPSETSRRLSPHPPATKPSGAPARSAPRTRPGWFVPFAAGLVGVVGVLAAVVYVLSGTDEPPLPQAAQAPLPDTVPMSLTEIRNIQNAIRTAQDELTQSAGTAEAAQAGTRAPEAFGRAQAAQRDASSLLEKGSALITQRQYADAKTALEESLTRFHQARDEFGRAKEAAAANAAQEEADRRTVAQRAKVAREEAAAKQAAKAKTPPKRSEPAPIVASAPLPPAPHPAAPAARQDIEVVSEILTALKTAYEQRDLRTLQGNTVMSDGRARFLQQIFAEYSTVGVSISGLSMTPDAASAVISITKLVNRQGDSVVPGTEWKNAKVVIKKQHSQWGKVFW